MIKAITPIVAIVVIAGLIFYAMSQGINGALLAGGIAIIAGLAGYIAPHPKPKDNGKPKS